MSGYPRARDNLLRDFPSKEKARKMGVSSKCYFRLASTIRVDHPSLADLFQWIPHFSVVLRKPILDATRTGLSLGDPRHKEKLGDFFKTRGGIYHPFSNNRYGREN